MGRLHRFHLDIQERARLRRVVLGRGPDEQDAADVFFQGAVCGVNLAFGMLQQGFEDTGQFAGALAGIGPLLPVR